MNNKNPKVTIGIPTYYGGPSLVSAVKSILNSEGTHNFKLIVTIDGRPLEPEIEASLKKLGVKIIFNPKRGGQFARIKQLIELADTDLLILTQDDILFDKHTLTKIVESFTKNPDITMVGARLVPLPAKTYLEKVLETGVRIVHKIADHTNNGDNLLLASGRCLAFKTRHAKTFSIPEQVINSDAYLYFENKKRGGKFLALKDAVVYNKSAQTLSEHLKQSQRFQGSINELSSYQNGDLEKEYKLSALVAIRAIATELAKHPLTTISYLGLFAYTRANTSKMNQTKIGFWKTDRSTKKI